MSNPSELPETTRLTKSSIKSEPTGLDSSELLPADPLPGLEDGLLPGLNVPPLLQSSEFGTPSSTAPVELNFDNATEPSLQSSGLSSASSNATLNDSNAGTDSQLTQGLNASSSVVLGNPDVFAQNLFLPIGVTTDARGNVFVASESNLSAIVTKFSPDGTLTNRIPIGGITVGNVGHLATDPGSGQILKLTESGLLLGINPNNGAVTGILDLHNIPVDTSSIYDIATKTVGNFSGSLGLPSAYNYGDIAVFQRENATDLFVTGSSQAQAFRFAMRVRFQDGLAPQAKVIAFSSASTAGSYNLPPGIAINAQGTVLTTLSIQNRPATGTYDTPVAFGADFDSTPNAQDDPQILLGGVDLSSRGMTTDAAGNFYVATSIAGTSIGGVGGGGSLVVLPPTLDRVTGVVPGGVLSRAYDVAVNPTGNRLYMTIDSQVVAFPLSSVSGAQALSAPDVDGSTFTALPNNTLGAAPGAVRQSPFPDTPGWEGNNWSDNLVNPANVWASASAGQAVPMAI